MHSLTRLRWAGVLLLIAVVTSPDLVWDGSGTAYAFQEEEGDEPQEGQRGSRGRRGGGEEEEKIKPYGEVITDKAETDEGIFKVHKIEDKYYYEIPRSEMGKDFLWVTTIAKTTLGVGYGGQRLDNRVVRWERRGDQILLRDVEYDIVADPGHPIALAVEAANNPAIIQAFAVKAEGGDDSSPTAVIEVTPLFSREVQEFSARSRLQARNMDRGRSFVDRIDSFPTNIEARATHTYTKPPESGGSGGRRGPQPSSRFRRGMDPGSATVQIHSSMVKLPEDPMMPRLHDERVGYFSVRQTDYSRPEHKAVERRYITRWRLQKKDPSAELSEPLEPIVYWVDPATPPQWIPYVKRGVEKWQAAFEEAGFKNAIICKEAPAPEEDPEWHPEDARYSVIRWLPSDIENASGPHVHDPRTGQILETDIQFYHNVQNLLRSWYFLQVGHLDERAQQFPFPDELMGVLLEYVVAHEVGHTLGFPHNMKASSTYPLEKVRDPEWVRTMSHTPTLMDYSRFNYVAQPEDGIPIEDLIPKIGPYDKWAVMWGYKPIPGASTPDEEKAVLDEWARAQDDKPWLRFSTDGSQGSDPGELTEAVGDADAVAASELGLKNLQRVADMLLDVTTQEGENWDDLDELYGRLLGQWVREMGHVAALVGGFDSQQIHGGQQGVRFQPVSRERQSEAVGFLNENAFVTPQWLIRKEILRRIEPAGVLERVGSAQRRVLGSLLSSNRFNRLVEQEALDPSVAYQPAQFLDDLRRGVFSELYQQSVQVDAYRRNLQRAYLELADSRLNGSDGADDDMRPFLRGELMEISSRAENSLSRAADTASRYHLQDVHDRIERILDPRFPSSDGSDAAGRFGGLDEQLDEETSCWPDLVIRP
ncbi:MAG TPA: zinc-dependent metalloprotease [Acidobacteriota bacterium]|nr:zinc-dependent metalloprotease [Acidobacteriota bacterium]